VPRKPMTTVERLDDMKRDKSLSKKINQEDIDSCQKMRCKKLLRLEALINKGLNDSTLSRGMSWHGPGISVSRQRKETQWLTKHSSKHLLASLSLLMIEPLICAAVRISG